MNCASAGPSSVILIQLIGGGTTISQNVHTFRAMIAQNHGPPQPNATNACASSSRVRAPSWSLSNAASLAESCSAEMGLPPPSARRSLLGMSSPAT
jgi:hypothetical protein